ncbi:PAS domain S-box protein (plasmid) [Rhizobium sp. NIBRBAC000502774]|nr:PAS domain S-box protein [Rhizobium sp. NIBRBAC000502774]
MPNSKRSFMSSDMKLRTIEEKLNIGTWHWDLKTSEVTWSTGMFRIVGLDQFSVIPSLDLYQSLVHPDDQLDFSNAIGLATGKRLQDRTFRLIRPDGSLRWLRSKGQPYFDRNGTATSMFGVIADVTDMQDLVTSAAQEAILRDAMVALLGGHIWRAYPDGKLIETTEWSKLTGQTPSEARDWDTLSAVHPDDRQVFRDAWAEAIADGRRFQVEMRVKNHAGRYVSLYARAVAVVDDSGAIQEWIGYTHQDEMRRSREMNAAYLEPAQIRAARSLLGWSTARLAKETGVSFSTVRRMEISTSKIRKAALLRVREVLNLQGVTFSQDLEGGITVGFRGSMKAR